MYARHDQGIPDHGDDGARKNGHDAAHAAEDEQDDADTVAQQGADRGKRAH